MACAAVRPRRPTRAWFTLGALSGGLGPAGFRLWPGRATLELEAPCGPSISADPRLPLLLHGLRHPLLLWQQAIAGFASGGAGEVSPPRGPCGSVAITGTEQPAAKTVSLKSVAWRPDGPLPSVPSPAPYATAALCVASLVLADIAYISISLQQNPPPSVPLCVLHRPQPGALPEPALPQASSSAACCAR